MNIQFKLLLDKKNQETDTSPVALYFYYEGKRFIFYTSERCQTKDWDSKKQRFRKSYPGSSEANNYLESLEEKTKAAYRNYIAEGVIPTPTMLKNALVPLVIAPEVQAPKPRDFFAIWGDFFKHQYNEGIKESTLRSYRKTVNHLKAFAEETPLSVDTWTDEMYREFREHLTDKRDYHPNTIADITKHLKAFFNWCIQERIPLSLEHAKMKKVVVEPDTIFLTWDDVEKLQNVALSEAMGKVRDAFVFACLTGLRHADLRRLSKDQIVERDGIKVLSFIPEKTNSRTSKRVKRVEVPLMPAALHIIEKYQESYVKALPVLSNQKMNVYIKVIAKTAGIDEKIEVAIYRNGQAQTEMVPKYTKITCHTARHTFATISLQKGVPLEVVSRLLGHSDLKTTQIYARIVDSWKNRVMLDAWKEK
jgi:integrase/recombinase XerD